MRISSLCRVLGIVSAAATCLAFPRAAHATTVMEVPDNGSEQMGRGGAWVARASDPLAVMFNPAGLAGQDTRLTLQANINIMKSCFTRIKSANDTTQEPLAVNGVFPKVCNDGKPFPNPQLAFNYKVSDTVGVAFGVLGPSASGSMSWPEFVNDSGGVPQGAPQRYLLLNANTVLVTPTIGAGWEVVEHLRIGASFQWGIADLKFANASAALNADNQTPSVNDVKAELHVKQMFIPGFTAGTIWSPVDSLDLAGWFKWSAPIDATGDAVTSSPYFTRQVAAGDLSKVKHGDTSQADCGTGNPGLGDPCAGGKKAELKVNIPWEAKIGVRYHKPRPQVQAVAGDGAPAPEVNSHRRDPMSQDIFDIELDVTYAHNSMFKDLQVSFPGDATGNGLLPVNGTPGNFPPNADIPHNFKDVAGFRLGGDWNVLPDQLAIRAGAYIETTAQDGTYQNLDFAGGRKIGIALGGTYRIHLSKVHRNALEFHAGLGHTFIADQSNTDPNASGINGLAGSPCNPTANNANDPNHPNTCTDGRTKYRTNWPVNLGTITNAFTAINLGVSYRF